MQQSLFTPGALIPVMDALPGPWSLLSVLLYLTFVLHIVLMNAVVGMCVITLLPRLQYVLQGESETAPPNLYTPDVLLPKGVAFVVNFGIPPFLFLQTIYGQYIYTSSVLMAMWWLSVMLVVMMAYYGLYINMARRGISHTARTIALTIATVLLLWNAFLFVNNITLYQNPARWAAYATTASGVFLNSGEPQVVPRWLHFMVASLAVGGLCLALISYAGQRKAGITEQERSEQTAHEQRGLKWFFYATLTQIPVGLWFLLSQGYEQRMLYLGGSVLATGLFIIALSFATAALVNARKGHTMRVVALLSIVVLSMSGMRYLLRSSMLEPYYAPLMRPTDWGALSMFLVSLVVFTPVIFWMVRIYLRHDDPAELAEEEPILEAPENGVYLVNEIAIRNCDVLEGDDNACPSQGSKGGR